MLITVQIDTEKDGEEKAQRMFRADEAFLALNEVDNQLRNVLKYGERAIDSKFLQELRDIIHEDHILEIYN